MKQNEITFTTKDGTILDGVGFQTSDKSHTLMLLFLGLGGNARSKSVKYFSSALAKKGISTVVFSARGHGDSEGLFNFKMHQSDILELEKKYSAIAKKNKVSFVLTGHSLSGRAIVFSKVTSDVILLSPGLFHNHPKWVTLPVFHRIYLAWWNYLVFGSLSFRRFGSVHFTKDTFLDLIRETSHSDFPTNKLPVRCLLLMGSLDYVAKFNTSELRSQAKEILSQRYAICHDKVFLGLGHEFSDGSKTFMRTDQLSQILNAIMLFSRSGK